MNEGNTKRHNKNILPNSLIYIYIYIYNIDDQRGFDIKVIIRNYHFVKHCYNLNLPDNPKALVEIWATYRVSN